MSDTGEFNPALPQAQSDSVIVRWMDEELVIVDEASHAAHCLPNRIARVFMRCDGRQTAEQIAAAEDLELGEVTAALVQLGDAGLLATAPTKLDLTRRAFANRTVRATAIAAGAAPIITSMLLPAAAHASAVTCNTAELPCAGNSTRGYEYARSKATSECVGQGPCGAAAQCVGTSVYEAPNYYYTGKCHFPGVSPRTPHRR